MKKRKIIITITISMLIFFSGLCMGIVAEKDSNNYEIYLNDSLYYNAAMNKLSEYQKNRYNKTSFNCGDMALEWRDLFIDMGLNTSVMYGFNNDTGVGHVWIKVYFPDGIAYEFESTNIRFKSISENWGIIYEQIMEE